MGEKRLHNVVVVGLQGEVQCCQPICAEKIHGSTVPQQQLHHFNPAFVRGKVQWRPRRALGRCVHVHVVGGEQGFKHIEMTVLRSVVDHPCATRQLL
jgi:hypothetical protein